MKKQNKTKIGVGSVVKSKVGELETITREEIIKKIRKEMVRCVHSVMRKNNFLVQSEDG